MTKLLQRHGNSMALVFDKTMLEALNISPDMPLQVTIHGGCLIVAPVNVGVSEEDLAARIARLRPRYKTMLENLAK